MDFSLADYQPWTCMKVLIMLLVEWGNFYLYLLFSLCLLAVWVKTNKLKKWASELKKSKRQGKVTLYCSMHRQLYLFIKFTKCCTHTLYKITVIEVCKLIALLCSGMFTPTRATSCLSSSVLLELQATQPAPHSLLDPIPSAAPRTPL